MERAPSIIVNETIDRETWWAAIANAPQWLTLYAGEDGGPTMTTPSPGQVAYEAYWNVRQMPEVLWADLPHYQQFAWEAAAQAVLEAFLSSARRMTPRRWQPQPLPMEDEPHGT